MTIIQYIINLKILKMKNQVINSMNPVLIAFCNYKSEQLKKFDKNEPVDFETLSTVLGWQLIMNNCMADQQINVISKFLECLFFRFVFSSHEKGVNHQWSKDEIMKALIRGFGFEMNQENMEQFSGIIEKSLTHQKELTSELFELLTKN